MVWNLSLYHFHFQNNILEFHVSTLFIFIFKRDRKVGWTLYIRCCRRPPPLPGVVRSWQRYRPDSSTHFSKWNKIESELRGKHINKTRKGIYAQRTFPRPDSTFSLQALAVLVSLCVIPYPYDSELIVLCSWCRSTYCTPSSLVTIPLLWPACGLHPLDLLEFYIVILDY